MSKKIAVSARDYDVIRSPYVTEKSTLAGEQGKVVFKVAPDATKPEVKKAVEALFKVEVAKVNILNVKGKEKRFRGKKGQRSDVRKALVTLKGNASIDITAGV